MPAKIDGCGAKAADGHLFPATPNSPWQPAANDNADGLIREYLPQGTDLGTVTNAELSAIEARLNGRPRQILGVQTPDEVFSSLRLNEYLNVALQA
jgi:IS30 family transposase